MSRFVWIGLALAVAFAAGVRIRLLDLPFERDEGEYAYIGRLMLEGVPPYREAANLKTPGTHAVYALFLGVFGNSLHGVRFGLLLLNVATLLIVFALARRLSDPESAVPAAWSYAILSNGMGVLGLMGHASHFVAFFAALSFLLLLRARSSDRWPAWLCAGAAAGAGYVMKQPGFVFSIFAVGFALAAPGPSLRDRARRAGWTAAGALVPPLLMFAALAALGVFDRFWFWTVTYAGSHAGLVSLAWGMQNLADILPLVSLHTWPVWIGSLAGLVLLCFRKDAIPDRWAVCGFWIVSLLSLCPGLIFRNHYFLYLPPAYALGAAAGFRWLRDRRSRRFAWIAAAATCALPLWLHSGPWFTWSPEKLSHKAYGTTLFVDSVEIARRIEAMTLPSDKVAVLGSEPQICFYARRRSATQHLHPYGLMQPLPTARIMRDEMIEEIERARPRILVMVDDRNSWGWNPGSDLSIFAWAEGYASRHYSVVGIVEMEPLKPSIWTWGPEAQKYVPVCPSRINVLRRKD